MKFKFEETEKVGTLHLSGRILKNDRTELISLLEKTASMCSTLAIDISGVEKITKDNLGILESFTDIEIIGLKTD